MNTTMKLLHMTLVSLILFPSFSLSAMTPNTHSCGKMEEDSTQNQIDLKQLEKQLQTMLIDLSKLLRQRHKDKHLCRLRDRLAYQVGLVRVAEKSEDLCPDTISKLQQEIIQYMLQLQKNPSSENNTAHALDKPKKSQSDCVQPAYVSAFQARLKERKHRREHPGELSICDFTMMDPDNDDEIKESDKSFARTAIDNLSLAAWNHVIKPPLKLGARIVFVAFIVLDITVCGGGGIMYLASCDDDSVIIDFIQ